MRPCAVTENSETNPVLCVKLWSGTWNAWRVGVSELEAKFAILVRLDPRVSSIP